MVSTNKFGIEAPAPETITEKIANTDAAIEDPIMIILLSYLSDKEPIGHWNKAPANIVPTSNREVSNIESFIVIAYTDKSVNIGANIKPVQIIEKLPKGEILNNSLILIEVVFLNFGGFLFVKSIGIKAIENNKEIKINGS